MQIIKTDSTLIPEINEGKQLIQKTESFSDILAQYNVPFRKDNYYFRVGYTTLVQGWILHISVIYPQLPELLHILIPILISENVPFKIPENKSTAREILEGNLGLDQLGKVITIYPNSEISAITLAKKIIPLTLPYRGPVILTDAFLGGLVYTRYGSINSVIHRGNNSQSERFIYNDNNDLIIDSSAIPFKMHAWLKWPFTEINIPKPPKNTKHIHGIYRPISTLKFDPRGEVIKALYLKSLLRVGTCVIKIGKREMLADDTGRDIRDRLTWQKYVHDTLDGLIPLPKILDYFQEQGDTYLVMEFIKGKSLAERLSEINLKYKLWHQLSSNERSLILDWLITIIKIIDTLHESNFVHRDLAPGNFLINPKNNIFLIDTELAYKLDPNQKELPFELGTPGFMSPEQENVITPTYKEDIYGLGALMVHIFTTLSPTRFDIKDRKDLKNKFKFFINHDGIVNLIADCLNLDPIQRPNIKYILKEVLKFKIELTNNPSLPNDKIDNFNINALINNALSGLSKRPFPISDGIWMSNTLKQSNHLGLNQNDYSAYQGIHTGLSGVLYLLARAKQMGYNIENNINNYHSSHSYLNEKYLNNLSTLPPGLYKGAAGLAISLLEGVRAGLIEDSNQIRKQIQGCLEIHAPGLNLSEGVSGQGLVLLQCFEILDKTVFHTILDKYLERLLKSQQKDGSWNVNIFKKSTPMGLSLAYGQTGILIFLLECHNLYPNQKIKNAILISLDFILRRTGHLNWLFTKNYDSKIIRNNLESGDERIGIILCFIKAYSILKERRFKHIAEKSLSLYPTFIVNNNFSQDGGLAALGELYVEAGKAFNNEEWRNRAKYLVFLYFHTSKKRSDNSIYWTMNEHGKPTADLLIGNTGIIHFFLRYAHPNILGYILLN